MTDSRPDAKREQDTPTSPEERVTDTNYDGGGIGGGPGPGGLIEDDPSPPAERDGNGETHQRE